MTEKTPHSAVDRRKLLSTMALLPALSVARWTTPASAQTTTSSGALPSWSEGPARQAILDFVRDTTGPGSPKFVPPEQRIATFDQDGTPFLTKEPKLLLYDDSAGKPEGIHLMIGRRPRAAFGNSDGDREMLEYAGAGDGARLMMFVLHDDATREYAYGPAEGLPDTKVGTFTQELYDEAKKKNWTVISMKNDWKRIFLFE
jgi:hypothetical protein